MAQGSSVTYRVQPERGHEPSFFAARRMATISAWAVGSPSLSRAFRPRAITNPSFTTAAPTGTSPCGRARRAAPRASRMNRSSEGTTIRQGYDERTAGDPETRSQSDKMLEIDGRTSGLRRSARPAREAEGGFREARPEAPRPDAGHRPAVHDRGRRPRDPAALQPRLHALLSLGVVREGEGPPARARPRAPPPRARTVRRRRERPDHRRRPDAPP